MNGCINCKWNRMKVVDGVPDFKCDKNNNDVMKEWFTNSDRGDLPCFMAEKSAIAMKELIDAVEGV